MAKRKSRAEEQPREVTRKEQRRNVRERARNRKIMIATAIAVGLALLLVVAGIAQEFLIRPNSALATVGATQIITREFQKRVYLAQNQMLNQLARMQQLEQQFGNQGFFTSQISQLQATLASPFSLGVQVLDTLINEEVVIQQAAQRGITVTEEEIDEALREEVAAGEGAVTAPQATSTAESAAAATATATAWTPTPAPTIDVSSTVTATATAIPTPAPPPTVPLLSDAGYQTGLQKLEENLKEVAGMSLAEYRDVIRARLLEEKLSEVIGQEEVEETQEQVHARHILLNVREPTPEPTPLPEGFPTVEPTPSPTPLPEGFPTPTPTPGPRTDAETLALAQELRQRILAGEDFTTLAAEYSDDPTNAGSGGDLNWFSRGTMVPPFEEVAFTLPIGELSEPVKTDFGYHLLEVLEKDANRPKDEATLQQERAQAYQEWLRAQVAAAEVDRPTDLLSSMPRDLREGITVAQPQPQTQPQTLPEIQSEPQQ